MVGTLEDLHKQRIIFVDLTWPRVVFNHVILKKWKKHNSNEE
jgi:hypothetical protein